MRQRLLDFMRTPAPAVTAFLVTMTQAGSPSPRQVSYFADDDLVVGSITGPESAKAGHAARGGAATMVWVELTAQKPARMVSLEGDVELVTDGAVVRDFLERRAAWRGEPVHQPSLSRHLIRLRPRLLRAERFVDETTKALVVRDFATFAIQIPDEGG